jgi:hypothetical protein
VARSSGKYSRSKSSGGKYSKSKSSGGKYRSAITGRYVSAAHAQRHPKTTVKESHASKFAHSYIERHPDTFHELSKR